VSSTLSLGVQLEQRDYATTPAPLLGSLDPLFARGTRYPSVFASGSFSNTMRAGRAISLEDGVSVSGAVQRRWRDDRPDLASWRTTVSMRGYKSLAWGGFARHALAVRASGGVTDRNSTAELSVGGTSGTRAELLPGLQLGDPSRLFPVRGFAPGVQRGSRAVSGSVEYRAPLGMPSRGLGMVPLFLDRVSVAAFADGGRAWCDGAVRASAQASVLCLPAGVRDGWMASAGAELAMDLGVQWDTPFRVRLGWAQPVVRPLDIARGGTVFFTLGSSF
jgi:outer membrane protein assembly factor BamA